MRMLFVRGDVTDIFKIDDCYHVYVSLFNDNNYICQQLFTVQNKQELEEKFYDYLESKEFKCKLIHSKSLTIDYIQR